MLFSFEEFSLARCECQASHIFFKFFKTMQQRLHVWLTDRPLFLSQNSKL